MIFIEKLNNFLLYTMAESEEPNVPWHGRETESKVSNTEHLEHCCQVMLKSHH